MSDLLSIGRSGVLAYRDALAGVSENVVNANNDGFAKRQVVLKEQNVSSGPQFLYRNAASFNGVQAASVTRVWDQYRAVNAWSANSDASMASTRSQQLATVEQVVDDGDAGIGVKLTRIFTSADALAANPGDVPLRQNMIYALQDAAGALGQSAATLDRMSDTVYTQARGDIAQVNDAMIALSRLNTALKTSPAGTAGRAALEDQRDQLIGTISDRVGIDVAFAANGTATVRLNDYQGPIMVDAAIDNPGMLNLTRASDGRIAANLVSGGNVAAVTISSGSVAGLADVATTVADRRRQLDAIAGELATTINDWQAQGVTPAGDPGVALLSGSTATTLALAVTDPQAIAAADASGANGNLLALAGKRGAGGVEAHWQAIVSDQSLQVAAAKTHASTAAAQKDNAYAALDTVSGVDLDSEAADLMRFQQAYSASARVIQAARETIQTVLDLF